MMWSFGVESIPEDYPRILREILDNGREVGPRGLRTLELSPALLTSYNPRKRLFGHPHRNDVSIFTYIEGLWILLGEDTLDRLVPYVKAMSNFVNPKTGRLDGAYGPRVRSVWPLISPLAIQPSSGHILFNNSIDQMKLVYARLVKDPDTRQAVVSIFNPNRDFGPTKDLPCTLTWQFLQRNHKLDMIVNMRSQDAWLGLVYDTGEFSWIQEIMAGWLNLEVGRYFHIDGSLHLYEKDWEKAKKVVEYDSKFDLYAKTEILDARLGLLDFEKTLIALKVWEESCRKLSLNELSLDNFIKDENLHMTPFYESLCGVILAYNLRLKGFKDSSLDLVRNYKTDLSLIYKRRWENHV